MKRSLDRPAVASSFPLVEGSVSQTTIVDEKKTKTTALFDEVIFSRKYLTSAGSVNHQRLGPILPEQGERRYESVRILPQHPWNAIPCIEEALCITYRVLNRYHETSLSLDR